MPKPAGRRNTGRSIRSRRGENTATPAVGEQLFERAHMRDRDIVLFLGAGASNLCGLPTVEHFFEKVQDPRTRGFMDLCEELARRIAVEEGAEQKINWPIFDAEKLFGKLEQWASAAGIAGRAPIAESGRIPSLKIPVAELLAHL